jgi:hypothetical protein
MSNFCGFEVEKCECRDGCVFNQDVNNDAAARRAYYMDDRAPALLCIYPRKRSSTVVPNFGTAPVGTDKVNNFTAASSQDLCCKNRLGLRLYRCPTNGLVPECYKKCEDVGGKGCNCGC